MIELTSTLSLAEFVTEQRMAQGLRSEEALMKRAGVSRNILANVRSRNTDIRMGNAIAILNALGFTVTVAPTEAFRAMQQERRDAA